MSEEILLDEVRSTAGVLTGHDAEVAVFGVRLPDEPLEPGPTPLLDLLRAEAERSRDDA